MQISTSPRNIKVLYPLQILYFFYIYFIFGISLHSPLPTWVLDMLLSLAGSYLAQCTRYFSSIVTSSSDVLKSTWPCWFSVTKSSLLVYKIKSLSFSHHNLLGALFVQHWLLCCSPCFAIMAMLLPLCIIKLTLSETPHSFYSTFSFVK